MIRISAEELCERGVAYLAQEPGDHVAKDDSFVRLVIIRRRRDTGKVPEVTLPFVQTIRTVRHLRSATKIDWFTGCNKILYQRVTP